MPLFQNEVGPPKKSVLYVWSAVEGGASNKTAVITAHGGKAKVNGMASVPDSRLVFYSPHGHILNDPSLEAIVARRVKPCGDPVSSKQSQDYELGKYTNSTANPNWLHKHNKANETYASVGGLQERFANAHQSASDLQEALLELSELDPLQQTQLAEQAALSELYADLTMDVITIRNRFWVSDPKLSDVLIKLSENGYNYDEIHCNFCRGGGEGYSPEKIQLGS